MHFENQINELYYNSFVIFFFFLKQTYYLVKERYNVISAWSIFSKPIFSLYTVFSGSSKLKVKNVNLAPLENIRPLLLIYLLLATGFIIFFIFRFHTWRISTQWSSWLKSLTLPAVLDFLSQENEWRKHVVRWDAMLDGFSAHRASKCWYVMSETVKD